MTYHRLSHISSYTSNTKVGTRSGQWTAVLITTNAGGYVRSAQNERGAMPRLEGAHSCPLITLSLSLIHQPKLAEIEPNCVVRSESASEN